MVRAPCCEKEGLKKGSWTAEEDQILVSYIQKHGHGNWRALPKLAGLLRCGKSCRLRWINYLRPNIKRGNFTEEELKTIIQLHEVLGNRWSAIAAKLPGRTDNEIKNVWHTNLKKKQLQKQDSKQKHSKPNKSIRNSKSKQNKPTPNSSDHPVIDLTKIDQNEPRPPSSPPRPSSSDVNSSVLDSPIAASITHDISNVTGKNMENLFENFPMINEDFWSDPELVEISSMSPISFGEIQSEFRFTSADFIELGCQNPGSDPNIDDEMDFWYDLFVESGGLEEEV